MLTLEPPQDKLSPLKAEIREYWNTHIHDLSVARNPVGSRAFFRELDEYRFDKLNYLPKVVDFAGYRGKKVLEVGCGIGIDLLRFSREGARVTGVDLSPTAIDLARKNFTQNNQKADFRVMDGEHLQFEDNQFDMVYAHGVLQYTANPLQMLNEIKRVLKPGGHAILMVYNRISWLNLMRQVTNVALEHEDAPVIRKFSIGELKKMLRIFPRARIVVERFPVKTRLHTGTKALIYNTFFVGTFNALPRPLVRRFGWHIMAFAEK
jgi:ubiquinone/menaquinone biosynthesis C-methylase UbiE